MLLSCFALPLPGACVVLLWVLLVCVRGVCWFDLLRLCFLFFVCGGVMLSYGAFLLLDVALHCALHCALLRWRCTGLFLIVAVAALPWAQACSTVQHSGEL